MQAREGHSREVAGEGLEQSTGEVPCQTPPALHGTVFDL